MRTRDSGLELQGAGVAVEKVGLCVGVEQRMVLVLAVHSHQVSTQLAELPRVRAPAIDSCGAFLADLSQQHQGRPARLEKTLDRRTIGSMPDLVRPTPRAKRQSEGIDDQRLTASGLTREQIEAGPKPNAGVGHQGQVPDPELSQHYFMGTSGRPQPSFSPSRL